MLNTRLSSGQTGMTLIELMFAIAIIGILSSIAIPSFQSWMQNVQIRTAAESVTSGILRARAEAVKRNSTVAFTLGAGTSWTVTEVATGNQLDSRASSEGSKNVTIVAVAVDLATPATTISFNNLGVAIAAAGALAQIDFNAVGGPRNLRVTIGLGGNARMCDPNLSTGPSAC